MKATAIPMRCLLQLCRVDDRVGYGMDGNYDKQYMQESKEDQGLEEAL